MSVRSNPRLCTSIRQLQRDCTFNAAKYGDIKSGVDFQRNRARYEKRLEINNKRLELAKAYRDEEASNYFRSTAPLTKLFVALNFAVLFVFLVFVFVLFLLIKI